MEFSITAEVTFDAGHRLSIPESCSRSHGHAYRVAATVAGPLDVKVGFPAGSSGLATALRDIRNELHGRDFADMIPGLVATPTNLAAWIMERLLLGYPRLVRVQVDQSDGADRLIGVAERILR